MEDDDDMGDDDDGYGSDLYKDEDDRRMLASMTELDREMILHDRAEARDKERQRKALLKNAAMDKGGADKVGTHSMARRGNSRGRLQLGTRGACTDCAPRNAMRNLAWGGRMAHGRGVWTVCFCACLCACEREREMHAGRERDGWGGGAGGA